MKKLNLDNIETITEGEYKRPIGGFICKITKVTDVPEKSYLKIEYDIVEGEFKGYFTELREKKGMVNAGTFIRSYKDTALGFFKGFITAVEESNEGYKFNGDETTLKGKKVGIIIGEEEYEYNGEVKTGIKVRWIRNVEAIKNNDYTMPEKKVLAQTVSATAECPDVFGAKSNSSNTETKTSISDAVEIDADDDLPF